MVIPTVRVVKNTSNNTGNVVAHCRAAWVSESRREVQWAQRVASRFTTDLQC